MNNRFTTLVADIQKLARELVSETYQIKPPPPDLGPALIDLAAAEDASDAHYTKWEGVPYETSEDQRAEWGPICWRLQAARDAVLRYARAYAAETRRAETEPAREGDDRG